MFASPKQRLVSTSHSMASIITNQHNNFSQQYFVRSEKAKKKKEKVLEYCVVWMINRDVRSFVVKMYKPA